MNEENNIGISIICRSQIDITATGITNNFNKASVPMTDKAGQKITDQISWNKSRNQQRNFETIIQGISLRSQPIFEELPEVDEEASEKTWVFKFRIEHKDAFRRDDEELGILLDDLNYVPCILKLTESAQIEEPIFITRGPKANIQFDILQ